MTATSAPATVTFRIAIPAPSARVRTPSYISAATKSATIAVGQASATVNCTNVCSGSIAAPVGLDTFTVKLFDAQAGAGNLLSTGTTTQPIVADQNNAVNVTFNPVVASVAVAFTPATIVPDTAGTATVSVNALDAAGDTIVGPGAFVDANGTPAPISLANSDTSGASSLSTTTLTQPGTAVTLTYTAALGAAPTITATTNGATAHTQLLFAMPTIAGLSSAAGPIGTTVAQTLTGTSFAPNAQVTVSGTGVTVTNVTVVSPTTITANFFVDPEAATTARTVTVTTAGGAATQTFSVSNLAGGQPVIVVTKTTDTISAAVPGQCPDGAAGELRHAMCTATADATIVFDTTQMCGAAACAITLGAPLPMLAQDQTIDGGVYGRVTIDGNSAYRVFYAKSGTITIANLQIRNAKATGGAGASGVSVSAGGGGAGLGAGLFVDAATVAIVNDYFANPSAVGGNGGNSGGSGLAGGGGGGGLSGAGGTFGFFFGAGGGGGLLTSGFSGASLNGGAGGVGYAGSGGTGGTGSNNSTLATSGGPGGYGDGGGGGGGCLSCGPFSLSPGGNGGAGGFGGGGGGGGGGANGAVGGAGGFGGGGGGSDGFNGDRGGDGGPGGGAGVGAPAGTPGSLGHGVTGGNANGNQGFSGGGAAAGPAIFVTTGTLATTNSGATGCVATGGAAGGTGAGAGTADATCVFNYGGTVNGSTATGPLGNALGTAIP